MEELRNEKNLDELTELFVEKCAEESNLSFKKAFVIGGGVLISGATALAVKNRDKIKAKLEERKISKLEKKGYVVTKSGEAQEVSYSVETDEVED